MLTRYALLFVSCSAAICGAAERIYIMPGTGYNQCDPLLVTAIQSQGHTVIVAADTDTTLPVGFTTTCVDPVNGYDWLCLFGNADRVPLVPELQVYLDLGGKIYLQWEVTCCTISSLSCATIANTLTNAPIVADGSPGLAGASANTPAWEAVAIEGCLNVQGNAYKGMDGVPTLNRLVATANLNGSTPVISSCPVFGFVFGPNDLPNGSGGIIGFGDVNLWYESAGEPPNNFGTQPVDMDVVSLVFPTPTSGCSLLPPGCLSGTTATPDPDRPMVREVYPNPANDLLNVELLRGTVKELRVFNAQGKCVLFERPSATGRTVVPIAFLTEGLYHLVLNGSTSRQEWSFVIAR